MMAICLFEAGFSSRVLKAIHCPSREPVGGEFVRVGFDDDLVATETARQFQAQIGDTGPQRA